MVQVQRYAFYDIFYISFCTFRVGRKRYYEYCFTIEIKFNNNLIIYYYSKFNSIHTMHICINNAYIMCTVGSTCKHMCIDITMCINFAIFFMHDYIFHILVIFACILPTFIVFNIHVLYLFIFFISC